MSCARALIFGLGAAFAGGAALAAPPAGQLLDRSQDQILLRAPITSRGRTHGEVRLVERGSAQVVQTLLYSKVLGRVVAEIRDKERENWPADRAGHDASARYVAALERAEKSIPALPDSPRSAPAARRRALLIEFAVSDSREVVALLEPELKELDGALAIEAARLIEALELSRDFIQRDMRLIAEEHFAAQRDELTRVLGPLEPAPGGGAQQEGAVGGKP